MIQTPEIPDNYFAGGKGITEYTGTTEVGDLADILQKMRQDLQRGDGSLTGTGVVSGPSQTVEVNLPGGPDVNFDVAIPAGITVTVVDAKVINKGAGAAGDELTLQKYPTGGPGADITDALDIQGAANSLVRAAQINTSNNALDGDAGDSLRFEYVDAAGDNGPAVVCYVELFVTLN